jgi:metal-dependent HD superfamily phosphatase/phosphodiesterase
MDDRQRDGAAPVESQQAEGFDQPRPVAPEDTPPGAAPLRAGELIRLPTRNNRTLRRALAAVNADEDLHAIWRCQNVNGVDRLGMSDHGPVHMQIVSNISLRLLRLLVARGIEPSIVRDHGLAPHDAEVVVVLAALLHDTGMSVHRDEHELMSLFVALPKLQALLADLYEPGPRRVVISETLHAIITHRTEGRPLTLEAGVVRVGDALDMARGRSRIPFEAGHVNIHSVSAVAIERVDIGPGDPKAIRVEIHMSNAAGIFQIDELLREKLRGSGLEPHVEVLATVSGEADQRLFETFEY